MNREAEARILLMQQGIIAINKYAKIDVCDNGDVFVWYKNTAWPFHFVALLPAL